MVIQGYEILIMETFKEIIKKACQESTLLDALTYACICESERIVKQVTTNYGSGRDGAGWDTCFKIYLKEILTRYNKDEEAIKQLRNDFAEVSETLLNNKTIYFKVKEERDQWKGIIMNNTRDIIKSGIVYAGTNPLIGTCTTNSSLCCHWCGISLGNATTVTYLNGNLPVCDLCLLKANTKDKQVIESSPVTFFKYVQWEDK